MTRAVFSKHQDTHRIFRDVNTLLNDNSQEVLNDYGLNVSQFTLLVLVQEEEYTRQTALSSQMLVSKSSVTRMVDQLSSLGYIKRLSDQTDRRAQQIQLTEKGQDLLHKASEAYYQSLESILAALNSREQNELIRLMDKLRLSLISGAGGS